MLLSTRKRYLTGPDWVIGTLDRMMKNRTAAGSMSQIVLELDAKVDEDEIADALDGFLNRFPVLFGSVRRDLKLAPYWNIPSQAPRRSALTIHRRDTAGPLLPRLEACANAPFRDETDHLAFHLFADGNRSILAMAFDHRLFDARGAELFLNMFSRELSDAHGGKGALSFASTAALSRWPDKFRAGRNVNRRIQALSRKAKPEALPLPAAEGKGYRYRVLAFNEQETAGIYDQAYREAGYLMESPYLLAVILQSMHEVFAKRGGSHGDYLIPVTMDLRPGKDQLQETFFNYVSYLFYQVPVAAAGDRKTVIAALKEQMYDQVKSGFPRDLAEASLLTRIAPLPLLGKLLHLPLEGKMATFAFSHLGKSAYQSETLLGGRVGNLFHMPRVPVPPGLGFFSNMFSGRLNLVISHLDGLLAEDELQLLEAGIRTRFCTRSSS